MTVSPDDLSAEEEFASIVNLAMTDAVEDSADPDLVARVCLNTVRDLYNHYGAGEKHTNYLAFVTDAQLEQAEIEEVLDYVEDGV